MKPSVWGGMPCTDRPATMKPTVPASAIGSPSAAEVEGYLNEMPGVAESAVVGVPHPDFGEGVVAVVVPRPGAAVDPAAMIAALKSKIANFKVPKQVFVVGELPRNAMGKVQKNVLREKLAPPAVT